KQIDALPDAAKSLYSTFLLSQKIEWLEQKRKELSRVTKLGFSKKLYKEVLIETAKICSEPLTESQFKTVLEGPVFAIHQSYIKGEKTDYWWLVFLLYAVNPDKMKTVIIKNVGFLMKLQNSKYEKITMSELPGFYINENSYSSYPVHIKQWSIIKQSSERTDYEYNNYRHPFYHSLVHNENGIVIFPLGHIFLNKLVKDFEDVFIRQIDFFDPENPKFLQHVFDKLNNNFNLLSNPEYLLLVNQLLGKNLEYTVYQVLYRVLDSALKAAPDADKKNQGAEYSELLIKLLSKSGRGFQDKEILTNNQWEKLAAVYQLKNNTTNQERVLAHIPLEERVFSRQRLAIEIPAKEKSELRDKISSLRVNAASNMAKVTTLEAYSTCFKMLVQANELEKLLASIEKQESSEKEKSAPFTPGKSFNIDKFFNAAVLELETYKNNRKVVSTDVFKIKAENKVLALIIQAFNAQLKCDQQLNFNSIYTALDQGLKPDVKITQGLRTLLTTIQTQLNEISNACGMVRPSHSNDFGNAAPIHNKF
ncbi:MAG: hypothetical protein JSS53_08250, partial [Proteobacteria bacterium]|nr:hypothetical protein [Pseudomonadota bacterium]